MTDDDMNSWLLNGPMAGISDDDPGGWQYGSHLMEGAPPSLLEDAPPLDAAEVPANAAEAKPAKAEGASDAARQDALRQVLAELEDIKKLL